MTHASSLPRRLSVDDPICPLIGPIRIFLDGVEIREVVAYDIDRCQVTRFKRAGPERKLVIVGNYHLATESLVGAVAVEQHLGPVAA